ncbi:NAD(P)-dependent alcohol dehydrogenase [Sphingomonas agri]|uniref:NAD(P)-dependent alcohol dehydrogenase n=1 Tax=Sphingomonas agri TaxID=1813878 RepID=UPI00311D43EB
MRMKAAVARHPGQNFSLETVELEEPRDDEILIRIEAAGVCHTDLVFRDMETGLALPAVLGHEGAGIVERVGARVTKVVEGDRVLITFRSCGECDRCREKLPAYCRQLPQLNFVGMRPDGSTTIRSDDQPISSNFFGQSSFATHALAYERNVVRLDPGLSPVTYAPLGCGVQTGAGGIMRSLACSAGSSLVVIGGGTVGLSAILGAVIQGCNPIILIEPIAERRALAIELGATHVIDPMAADVPAAVVEIAPGGVDFVFDTSGIPAALESAFGYLGSHGAVGLVGVPSIAGATLSVPIAQAITFGFSVKGIIEGDSDPDEFIPELIRLHREGRFPFDRLITSFPFDKINEAIEDQHAGKCVKVVLEMPAGK